MIRRWNLLSTFPGKKSHFGLTGAALKHAARVDGKKNTYFKEFRVTISSKQKFVILGGPCFVFNCGGLQTRKLGQFVKKSSFR